MTLIPVVQLMAPASAATVAGPPVRPFARVSLARQFLAAGACVVVAGVVAVGLWVSSQIERSVVNRTARIAAVYFESIVAGRVDELITNGSLGAQTRRMLDGLFVDSPLARKVVRFKLWTPDGRIHYSSEHGQDGMKFPLHDHHAMALSGQVVATMSKLDGPDNAPERAHWSRLLEVYVPLRARGSDEVRAVAEFYHSTENIDAEIQRAQRESWLAITLGALALYSVLYVLVHRASRTISGQQVDLTRQLEHLQQLLQDNHRMHLRVLEAGAQTTALGELSLRRVAADLHDGPAQDLAFALLRLDDALPVEDARLRRSLQRAMTSIREIAGGLVVPGLAGFSLADVMRRTVRDAECKSGVAIDAEIDDRLGATHEALKITAYRVVQEALSNSLRHAAGHPPRVRALRRGGHLLIEVGDDGPGFDPQRPTAEGHLGLAFVRERVRLLGGILELRSAPGQGTMLQASIPLDQPGRGDD